MDTATAGPTAAEDRAGPRRRGRRPAAWCAALLFAGVSAVVGCRIADTDGVTPVPQLLAFLPWLLVPTAAGLLFTLLARWWAGAVWGVLLLGLLAWFIEPYGKTGEPAGRPVATLRVLTSNVEFGQGTGSLIGAVRREEPDLVFVQECEYTCDAALKRELADAYPHRRAVAGGGSEGSVILSRFPLRDADGVPGTMGMPGAVADVDGHAVRLQLAHPMPPLPGQVDLWQRELGRLRAVAAADRDTPTVLAGDFNASQDHAAFRRILDTGLHDAARLDGADRTPTWPARTMPVFGTQIDHVLVSEEFAAGRARFLDLAGTDHRALVVDLTLHAPR
ncbi:endonuclease/exonuclease/phosphatase family protein [Streptomyces griseomycini]|uniref:Endonuclease/exonuclease/phosphatase (EEP) superfamily protein YafD n=1 Tax=Streptomyces griseomycini TaxID=66895 RepID=A0A7W7LX81_9ACTN|nr:endonuclease/exonuclease/phosphatase family protein [Streptomyces griseomycini]MBB4898032.1 endonuclease/exonuclease/phosphatase (EEP) superfamily protein YafD [Streptomyces griseomycini]GGQ08689.1 membrane protein [Streptomyces griseomycini]GGR32116.1 membrane protein [Streptomyces griseomycini]